MVRNIRSSARLAAIAFAGASMLTLAACNDENSAANAIVQPDAGQADSSSSGSAGASSSSSSSSATTDNAAGAQSAQSAPAGADTAPALTPAAEPPESSGSVNVADLMAEQPLPDVVQGDPNAPVTIVEYASMTCGHCADFHENSYPAIKKAYVDTGKAKLILREFPFDPVSLAAFMLARCTGDDAKRTAMVDVLFDQQNTWARAESPSAELLKIARMAGMSQDEFVACLDNRELQQQIVDVQKAGQNDFGVDATPTFFINGTKYAGSMSPEKMAAAIEAASPSN